MPLPGLFLELPHRHSRLWIGVLAIALIALSGISDASAEFDIDAQQLRELSPRPGTVITADNLAQFGYLLDPEVRSLIARGWLSIPVSDVTSFKPHAAYILSLIHI